MRISHRLAAGLLAALAAVTLTVRPSAQEPIPGAFLPGEILVKFVPGVSGRARADAHRRSGGVLLDEIGRTGVQRIAVRPGDEAAAIARYRRHPNVLYAEPNYIRTIPSVLSHGDGTEVRPGDRYFDEQWGLHNTGQAFQCLPTGGSEWCFYQGTPDADIDAPEAWALSTGAPVRVAVIDSGVDYAHPDLAGPYLGGYDFFNGDADPMDDHGHGTHVAGTIAAAMNNLTGTPADEEGVAGVAPNAEIFAYKVCGANGTCSDFAIQQAIAASVADGARVINMSLGGAQFSQSTYEAVQDAWNAGVVVVAAAGNGGTTALTYPAGYDNVISVGAFNEDHDRASFSNYGSWVDISAPGAVIMSSYRMSGCATADSPGDTGCYTWSSGTSMAAPHVSGAAALVWSRPDVTSNSQVASILLNSADPVGVSTVRLDSWTIHGGLNLHDAIAYGSTRPSAHAGPDRTVTDTEGDGAETVRLDGGASTDINGSIVSYQWREGATLLATGVAADVPLSLGAHTITLEVTDNDGETDTDAVVITVDPSNQVTVTASTPQAREAGPQDGVFTISRTGSLNAPLTVRYAVAGTAAVGSDYVALSGTVTIDAGSSTGTIAVTPVDDGLYESDESVIITIVAEGAYTVRSPASATVTVVSDDLPPDLIVASLAAPATAGADTDIVVSDTTKNQGTGSSVASATGFFLSTNLSHEAADVFLGGRPVPALAAGAADALSTTLRVPASTATGSYYVLAKADWSGSVPEDKETNNVRASGIVRIGPDLIVSALSAPAAAAAGGAITIPDTTRNQGGGGAEASTTRFYLSANFSLDASDVMLGGRPVPPLPAGASDSATVSLVIPAGTPAGSYYIVAQADAANAVRETTEGNNTRTSSVVQIGPDLIVTALSGPSTAAAGGTIAVSDTTRNQGAGSAAASATGFYLSSDLIFGATDVFLGSRPVGSLAPSGSSSGSTPVVVPAGTTSGSYYIIAVADSGAAVAESIETNNTRVAAVRIGPDLIVSAFSAPSSAAAGASISVSDTTQNQGAGAAEASLTSFYLSSNLVLDTSDIVLGTRAVPSLGATLSDTKSIILVIPASTAAGTYYIIAKADGDNAVVESLENNNTRARSISIGPAQ